ncbi:MAG: ATP-binding protein [Burkholderiaceae bacterium]
MTLLANASTQDGATPFAWRASLLTTAAAVAIGVFSLVVASSPESVALLWYPTALFTCLLITQAPRHWPLIAVLCYASVWLARVLSESSLSLHLLDWILPAVSASGALVMAGTIRQFVCKPLSLDPLLDQDWFLRLDLSAFFRLLAASILPGVLVPALTGSLLLSVVVGAPFLMTFEKWAAGDGLGAVSLLPIAFCLMAGSIQTTVRALLTLKSFLFLGLLLLALVTYAYSEFILFYTTTILAAAAAVTNLRTTSALTLIVSVVIGYGVEYGLFIDNPQMGADSFLTTYVPLILGLLPGLFIAVSRQEVDNRLLRTRSMLDQSEQIRAVMTNEIPLFSFVRTLGSDDSFYLTPALKQYLYGDANALGPFLSEDIICPDDLPTMREAMIKNQFEPVPFSTELRMRRSDGQDVWHKITSYPVIGDAGQVVQRVGVMLDVDDLREVQSQLEAQTIALTRSNQSLELFAVAASHDLQEPLRMVSGYTQLLKKRYASELNDDAKSMIDTAADASVRMSRLIQELLAFSRVSSPNRIDEATVAAAIDNASHLLARKIRESKAIIEVANDIPAVNLTQSALNQLMLNLLGNAIRYRSDKAPLIRVDLLSTTPSEATIVFQDNGIGIELEYHELAFDVFKRFNNERAAEKPGSGIGLALCKRIAESGGGRIAINSDGQNGTAFEITLKLAFSPHPAPAVQPSSARTEPTVNN